MRVAAVVVLLGLTVAALLWFAPVFRLDTVEYRTSPEHVAALRTAAPVEKGRPLVEVDPATVEAAVLGEPLFQAASVRRSWPSTLVVEATARTPVVGVEGPELEGVRLVAADGVGYETVPEAPADLPVAHAEAPGSAQVLSSVASFVTRLDADLLSQARDIRVDDRGRITATLANVQVVWGTAEEPALKAAVVRDLVGRAGVARVDVSVPMEPVTSRERRPIEGATPRATGDPTGAESPRDDGEGAGGTAGAEAPSGPTDTASEGPDTTRRQ